MVERRTRNRARTEAALLAAARAQLEHKNYDVIRVQDIADVAGCNHGLITQYFGTKAGLFTRVFHQLAAELSTALEQPDWGRTLLGSPLSAMFWRLLAALLDAGVDPAVVVPAGTPLLEKVVGNASALTGRSPESLRSLVAFLGMAVGGYHVFSPVLATINSPTGSPEEPFASFEAILNLIAKGVNDQ
jgi:AcrR family transcriptional regulator